MHIHFKKLRWKNFLSTGNVFTEIDLSTSKSTLVVGDNGSGKSTALDALSWCLYNKPFRKINKPQLVNSINKKNCVAEVEFSIGKHEFKIIRGIKPNMFKIYKDDELIDQNASTRDYQEYLERNILKLNHKSFCQIVIIGSTNYVSFMKLPSHHRRDIIENILDIQIFSTMHSILKDKLSSIKESINDLKYHRDIASEKVSLQHENLDRIKTDYNKRLKNLKKKREELFNDKTDKKNIIKESKTNIDSIKKRLNEEQKKYDDVLSKYEESLSDRKHIVDKVKKLDKDNKFFKNNDNCPTCTQAIDELFKEETIQKNKDNISGLKDSYNNIESVIEKLSNSVDEQKQVVDNIKNNELQTEMNNVIINDTAIDSIENHIRSVEKEINDLENEKTDVTTDDTRIKELEDMIEQYNSDLSDYQHRKRVYDVMYYMLKDSGIKARIIKQYIPIINKLINKYLAAMEFFVNFELDENFNESIKSRFRDDFSYDSFSEGEKMRIDLAILFTWRSISKMRNSVSTNLLIMDEVFDSSLDGSGTDEFIKILNNLTSDTNTFIISHKGDTLFDKFDSVIRFEKNKNFSKMVA